MIASSISVLAIPKVPGISLRFLGILGSVLAALLLVFYIFQVNEITKANFSISSCQKQIAVLSQTKRNLEFEFSQMNSSAALEAVLGSLNYEGIDKIHYIQLMESTVAVKPK